MLGGNMAGMLPTFTETTEYVLSVGGRAVSLPRLNLNDAKTFALRATQFRDLTFSQSTWPRKRDVSLVFGRLPKAQAYKQLDRLKNLLVNRAGLLGTLKFPSRFGIASYTIIGLPLEMSLKELDNCAYGISLRMLVTGEYYPGGMAS